MEDQNSSPSSSRTSAPQKSILVNRSVREMQSKDSIKVNFSADTGFKFFVTTGRDSQIPNAEGFIYMTIPPDGGYAWLIFVMAFFCHVIIDGVIFSIGIILPSIAAELSMSHKQVALIASTQIGIYFLSAPLGSAFINKFGFRSVAVSGSLFAALAVFAASFIQGTLMLVMVYGVIAGVAMGMLWMSTSLIVNYYFEQYRALVSGFVSSGSGVGVMLISMLNVHALAAIGWRNTIRIHVVLLVISGILSFSYKEVKPTKVGQYMEANLDDDSDESANSVEISSGRFSLGSLDMKSVPSDISEAKNITKRLVPILDAEEKEKQRKPCLECICPCCAHESIPTQEEGKAYIIIHRPLDRDDAFYDGHPDLVRPLSPDVSETQPIELLASKVTRSINYSLSMIRAPSQAFNEESNATRLSFDFKDAFNMLFDCQLVRLPEFRVLLCVAFLFPLGFNIPFMYSFSRAEIPRERAAMIPVVIGLTNIVFRIIVGFVAYRIDFHTAYLAGFGMVIGGLVTLLSGFMGESSELFQFTFAICFAFGSACNGALRAIIYVKVLGLDRLTNAFGLSAMVMGIGVFLGTNMAGIMNDMFDSYHVSFIFSGICMTIAGLLNLCIPTYSAHRRSVEARRGQKKVRFTGLSSRKKWWRKVSQAL